MRLEDIYLEAGRRYADRLAVVGSDGRWSYAAIDLGAHHLAHRLLALGVCPGDRVGVWLPKGGRAIAAFQAVLRAGAAYVPLDPGSPVDRISAILDDCTVQVLVSTSELADQLPTHLDEICSPALVTLDDRSELLEGEDGPLPGPAGSPRDLAYILYTSGSTGTPKGVCLSHDNALAFIQWACADIGAQPDDRFSNHAPFHFDLSVFDIYVPAKVGASLHIIGEASTYAPRRLVDHLVENEITVWYSVPSALVLMLDHAKLEERGAAHAPRVVIFAGEPFPMAQLRRLRALWSRARLLNYYGPTETNVCTSFEVRDIPDGATSVPIGSAASGDEVWAEGPDGRRATPGEEGELIVKGPTVMLGYWGRAPAGPIYRTGDIVQVLAERSFAYVGRQDGMVKRRGYRIELGEVECVLATVPGVQRAAAVMHGSGVEAQLVVYLVETNLPRPSIIQLKRFIAQKLPRYMIPDRFSWIEQLPLTANGKVDRRGLAALPLAS